MRKKKFIMILIVFIIFFLFLALNISIIYKHKIVESNNETNDNMAIMIDDGTGNYVESSETTFPTTGYAYNSTKSYCLEGSILSWNNTTHKITMSTDHPDKCYIYFDKNPVINSVISSDITSSSFTLTINATKGTNTISTYYFSKDNGSTYQSSGTNTYTYTGLSSNTAYNIKVYVQDSISNTSNIYSTTVTTLDVPLYSKILSDNSGLPSAPDDYGTSYYFSGIVTTNWVSFAGSLWRIIRINGDNTIRMIYSDYIGTSSFNSNATGESSLNYINSTIKSVIDTWYASNLTSYSSKIADSIYCNDKSLVNNQYYGPYNRMFITKIPILTCPNQSDAFTVSDTTHGNGNLTYPIGLITVDEASFAGDAADTDNNNSYINANQTFWTISPASYNGNGINFTVYSSGQLVVNSNDTSNYVRPVISLKSDVIGTGSGTSSDPYIVN
jgi:hypothetical protein